MMLAPEVFVNEHKNDSFEELIELRDEFIEEIKDLEAVVYDDEAMDKSSFCPSPRVRYQMSLEYLSKTCELLNKKFNDKYGVK